MTRLLCILLLVACSGRPGAPAHPTGNGSATPPADEGPGTQPGSAAETKPATNCDRLIDHVVTLAVAERPTDQQPTADERTQLTTQLRTTWSPKCSQLTSKGYDCALAAQTLGALEACGG